MSSLLIVGLVSFFSVFLTYALYFVFIYSKASSIDSYTKRISYIQQSNTKFPKLTIIVPAHNEAKTIYRKLKNISELDYPKDQLQILIADDFSNDSTEEIARSALVEFGLNGKISSASERLGLNKLLNWAVNQARNSIICVTDADVTLERSALKKSISILENFEDAGGVTGRINPVFDKDGIATKSESNYRNYYHQCMLAESSIHSAFPGNGPLIIFKKSAVPQIPADYGSTDANIAMKIIKSGQRLLYVPNAIINEPVPENVGQQKLQKVRRAKRLIQVFLHNANIFANSKYGKFGELVFPLKFMMHVICPALIILGAVTTIMFGILSASFAVQLALTLLVGVFFICTIVSQRIRGLFFSFSLHQIYLLIGLFSSPKRSFTWKIIDRK